MMQSTMLMAGAVAVATVISMTDQVAAINANSVNPCDAACKAANQLLRDKVFMWCTNKRRARETYGMPNEWDVGAVSDFRHLFSFTNCPSRTFNENLADWDVSSGTDFSYMFMHAKEFSSDISRWNVGNAETMAHMFYNAANFNSELADWDTARVMDMTNMFHMAYKFDQDITSWPKPDQSAGHGFASGRKSDSALRFKQSQKQYRDMTDTGAGSKKRTCDQNCMPACETACVNAQAPVSPPGTQ